MRVFHDDDYRIYVNGTLVLSGDGYTTNTPVEKTVSRYLKEGRNVIAAQVQQNAGSAYFDCGIYRTGNPDGIGEMPAVVEPAYYDLSGRRLAKPQNGIYIQRTADGKTAKHLSGTGR